MNIGSSAMVIEVEKTTPEIRARQDNDVQGERTRSLGMNIRLEQMTR